MINNKVCVNQSVHVLGMAGSSAPSTSQYGNLQEYVE